MSLDHELYDAPRNVSYCSSVVIVTRTLYKIYIFLSFKSFILFCLLFGKYTFCVVNLLVTFRVLYNIFFCVRNSKI